MAEARRGGALPEGEGLLAISSTLIPEGRRGESARGGLPTVTSRVSEVVECYSWTQRGFSRQVHLAV